jgi:hypothetical protein
MGGSIANVGMPQRSARGGRTASPVYWCALGILRAVKTLARLPIVVAALATTTAAQPQRFALAIVRLDGRIVPFAAYESGRWERAWPEADEATEGTPTVDGTPSIWRKRGAHVPVIWHVWPSSGGDRIDAHVKGAEIVDAHCTRQVALTTELAEAKEDGVVNISIAVDSNLPLSRVEEVRRSASSWRDAEQTVVASFSRLEAAKADVDYPQLRAETPTPTPELTKLYREANSARSPMYFVSEKKYRTPFSTQEPGCTVVTVMTGWLTPTAAGSLTLLDPRVFVTDCDRKEARTAFPLAAVHVQDRLFWVLQERGYEDETYVIVDIRRADVRHVIDANGGGC